MKEPKLYTLDEVAEIMKVSKSTVIFWIRSGKLERQKVGRLVRVTPEALKAFMKAQNGKTKEGGGDVNEPKILLNENGTPRLMGAGHYTQGVKQSLAGGNRLAYTDKPGYYAIIDADGKPTGLFFVVKLGC